MLFCGARWLNVPRTFRKREGLSDERRHRETPSARKVLGVILPTRWWRPIIDTHLREMGGRWHDNIIPSDVISVVLSTQYGGKKLHGRDRVHERCWKRCSRSAVDRVREVKGR
jgi:hypothetical protein